MLDVGRHPNISLLAYSEVETVEGQAGDFKVTVRRKARYVSAEKCTGCGACAEKCPVTVSDAFNEGMGTRGAVYSYFAQGIPSTHTIDAPNCRQLQGKKCGICAKTCQADAIDFEQEDRIVTLDVAAVILAVGYDVFDPARIPEYRFEEIPNVVTAIEFERLLSASGPTEGHLDRPSDRAVTAEIASLEKKAKKSQRMLDKLEKKFEEASDPFYQKYLDGQYPDDEDRKKWADRYANHLAIMEPLDALKKKAEGFSHAKRLAFIQCVGSRDFRFYPFCSGYCCMHSIKEAIIAHEHEPETTSFIFGMDIRAVGKGFEEYKVRGGNKSNITYIRGRIGEIMEGPDHNPVVTYEDTRERKVKSQDFDMVVLATACAPTKGVVELAGLFNVELDEYNFIKTSFLSPVDTSVPGIFVCGCATAPMDVPESVAQASSAAQRAAEIAFQSQSEKEKIVA
ncbi:MAG: CoB--CoM heterodisulfide reductase iron-sulfur subunit A family protein [Deltaproteobacteria bacterium]|nr:CoB--CoM heterodisulfide reductase iron-sulfur subunit A family protein [Deltaproteobacteria bacterium]